MIILLFKILSLFITNLEINMSRLIYIKEIPLSGIKGEWFEVGPLPCIRVCTLTDTNGVLTIEYSPDKINVDSDYEVTVTSNLNESHLFVNVQSWARVVFSYSQQPSFFRCEILGSNYAILNVPLTKQLQQDADSISVRPTDFALEVALQKRENHILWNKWAHNVDVDTGTETVWPPGGVHSIMSSASTFSIVSSSANDDLGNTGANTILIYYIDANRQAQTASVVMDGTTPVITSFTGLGINRSMVLLSGSAKSNVGNITITATNDSSIQAYITAAEGTTQQAIFFIQAGYSGIMSRLDCNAEKIVGGASPKVRFKMWRFSPLTNSNYLLFNRLLDTADSDTVSKHWPQFFFIEEQSVIYLEATTDSDNTIVNVDFDITEIKNT